MAAIFVSHASKNDSLVRVLEAWLKKHGFNQLFIDHANLRAGDRWRDELTAAAGACRVVLCLVTREWLDSGECFAEFTAARYMGKRIIPCLALDDRALEEVHVARLAKLKAVDQGVDLAKAGAPFTLDLYAHPDIAEPFKAGLRAAGGLNAKEALDPEAFEIDRNAKPEPFPGLESFGDTDADAALFYGRSVDIQRCQEKLRAMQEQGAAKVFTILGASGSGKSSLMKAGILPRLRREQAFIGVRSFRPGAEPLYNFCDAIARMEGADKSGGEMRDALLRLWRQDAKDDAGLVHALDGFLAPIKKRCNRPRATVLFAMDQGEELARVDSDEGPALGAVLAAAVHARRNDEAPPYALMMSVRSDSFPEVQGAPAFARLTCEVEDIRTVANYAFDSAIEQPAKRYGVDVEAELTRALMEDAGESKDGLPLLAFTLQRLWRAYAKSDTLRRIHYEQMGKLSGLLDDAAERALRGMSPLAAQDPITAKITDAKDKAAARVFVPALAQVNERGAAIRRVAKHSGFDEEAKELLKHFDAWRLVVKKADQVEVAHEAMFREWPRLSRWLEPEKQNLQALRALESDAAAWDARGRKDDDLTHRGRRLRAAQALLKREDYKAQIDQNDVANEYLNACARAERRRTHALAGGVSAAVLLLAAGGAVVQNRDWRSDLYTHATRITAEARPAEATALALGALPPPFAVSRLRSEGADAIAKGLGGARLAGDFGPLSFFRLSADGGFVAIKRDDAQGTGAVFDLKAGKKTELGPLGPLWLFKIPADGGVVAIRRNDAQETWVVFDLKTGMKTELGPLGRLQTFQFSPDGGFVAIQRVDAQRTGAVFDLKTGKKTELGPLRAFRLSADGGFVAIQRNDAQRTGAVFDLRTGKKTELGPLGRLQTFQLSADGGFVAVRRDDAQGTGAVFDLKTGKKTELGPLRSFDILADGGFVAIQRNDAQETWVVFDLKTGMKTELGPLGRLQTFQLSADGGFVAIRRDDAQRTGAVFDLKTGKKTELGPLRSFDILADGGFVAIQRNDAQETWVVFDLKTGMKTELGPLRSFDILADGGFVAIQRDDAQGTGAVFDLKTGKKTELGPLGRLQTFQFSADGGFVAIRRDDAQGTGAVFDLKTRKKTELGPLRSFDILADGGFVTIQRDDAQGTGAVFDLKTGKKTELGPLGRLQTFQFSPDGGFVAIRRDDAQGTGAVFDLKTGKKTELGPLGRLQTFQFSANGGFVAIRRDDAQGTGAVFDLKTGKKTELGPLRSFDISGDRGFLAIRRNDWQRTGAVFDLTRPVDVSGKGAKLAASICDANAHALRPLPRTFGSVEEEAEARNEQAARDPALRGRPWNPCDWRGLLAILPSAKYGNAAFEGPRQFWKLLMVRWGLEQDYACEAGTFGALKETLKARANMCALYAAPNEKAEEAAPPSVEP